MYEHSECHQGINYLVRSANAHNEGAHVCLDKVTGRFLCADVLRQNGLPVGLESEGRLSEQLIRRSSDDGVLPLDSGGSRRRKPLSLNGCCWKKLPLNATLSASANPACSNVGVQSLANGDQVRHHKLRAGGGQSYRARTFNWRRFLKKSRVVDRDLGQSRRLSNDSAKDLNQNTTWNRRCEGLPPITPEPHARRPTASVKDPTRASMSEEATSGGDSTVQSSESPSPRTAYRQPKPKTEPAADARAAGTLVDPAPASRNLTRKISRLIHVDGVNYKVTMEPPARTPKRQSPSTKRATVNGSAPLENGTLGGSTCSRPSSGQDDRLSNVTVSVNRSNTLPVDDPVAWDEMRNVTCKTIDLRCGEVVDPKQDEALDHAALRLRGLVGQLSDDRVCSVDVLRQNLQYAISVLESRHLKELSSAETNSFEDEMSTHLNGETPVPPEIKRWLLQTFSNSKADVRSKRDPEKRSLRSVVHAVQAGMFVERIFRKNIESTNNLPPVVVEKLKLGDSWSFDVFDLEEASDGNSLKYVYCHLLSKYDLIRKFKIPQKSLWSYCHKLQQGYRRHNNRYHNPIHAADVAQTLNCMLVQSGFVHWLSDQEIFAMITAAIVHDLEHTGTTNNFHTNTRSPLAQLYNDRSVLENHHISTAFRLMQEDDCDILVNMNKDDYQECRALMIDMVLATDMSQHFGQIQKMKSANLHPETLEKSRAMCLMIHSADINHPSKPWHLHHRWTERLVVEFFEQGDRERELGLPLSPLCDRHTTMVAQSQIGFIDYVIEPTFTILFEMYKQVNGPTVHDHILQSRANSASGTRGQAPSAAARSSAADDVLKRRFSDCSSYSSAITNQPHIVKTMNEARKMCFAYIEHNRMQWQRKNVIERENNLFGNDSFTKAPPFEPDPLPVFHSSSSNGVAPSVQPPKATSPEGTERTLDTNDVREPT